VVSGDRFNSALWTNAVEMGKAAGANMAGGKTACPSLLKTMNASVIDGVPMVSVGKTEADPEEETYAYEDSAGYRKLIFNGDRLTGCLFMGDVKGAGIYTNMIRNRIELSEGQKRKALSATLGYADFAIT